MEVDIIDKAACQCIVSSAPLSTDIRIAEELARFKVWVGNVGASRAGVDSLNFRLRDASHIRKQILSLLGDLDDCLKYANAIVEGKIEPWDQSREDFETRETERGEGSNVRVFVLQDNNYSGFDTEMEQIHADVTEIVNCLYQLSSTAQAPSPHDQYMIAHHYKVENAYISIDVSAIMAHELRETPLLLAVRLAEANARRRRYWQYRQQTRGKYNHQTGNDHESPVSAAQDEMLVNSSLMSSPQLRKINNLDIPVPPPQSPDGTLECPYCFTVILISTPHTWQQHVFSDLRPYICLEESCHNTGQHYLTRDQWVEHVLQHHWRTWNCVFCPIDSAESFESSQQLRRHLESGHGDSLGSHGQIDFLVQSGKQAKKLDTNTTCPLCAEFLQGSEAYSQHVGRHQEQVALLVFQDIKRPG